MSVALRACSSRLPRRSADDSGTVESEEATEQLIERLNCRGHAAESGSRNSRALAAATMGFSTLFGEIDLQDYVAKTSASGSTGVTRLPRRQELHRRR